jgi:integrase
MGIYKQPQSKYWHYRIHVPQSGKARPKTLRGSCRTAEREVALAVEHAMRMAVGRSAPADSLHRMIDALLGVSPLPGLPLGAVADAYSQAIQTAARSLSTHTVRDRIGACRRLAAWAAAERPATSTAEDVDRAAAAAFASHLAATGLTAKTRRNILGDLGTVWQELARSRDRMPSNPWPLALPEATSGSRGLPFSREQEAAVLAAADAPEASAWGWGLACRIARATGLRYGDVARLQWRDVDLDAGVIRTEPSKTARWSVTVAIPVPAALIARLRADRPENCSQTADCCSVSVLPRMAEAYPHAPWRHPFGQVLATAGLPANVYTFHSWRHTFRTRLAEAGISDEIARRLGGWTNDATAARYDHDGKLSELRAAVELAFV